MKVIDQFCIVNILDILKVHILFDQHWSYLNEDNDQEELVLTGSDHGYIYFGSLLLVN